MDASLGSVSRHFSLTMLAEDIYVATATNGGWAICNAGLIDLGGQLLVYDAFLTPQAGLDLRQFAIQRCGRAPQIVIDGHYHNDHTWGNQAFLPEALILSSKRTRELLATAGAEEFEWNATNAEARLAALRDQYEHTHNPRQRQDLLLWIGEYEGIVATLPHLGRCLPGITFDGPIELIGTKRSCRLIPYTGGHTDSDTVLYLPQEKIVFMGDLLFVGCHPYLADGDPQALLAALRDIGRLDAERFVPGHGPVGSREDVNLLITYIEECMATARRLVEEGNAGEAMLDEQIVPEAYRSWQIAEFYCRNIRFLCERILQSHV